MTYREQLVKARELGINICDLEIADECECMFDFDYTEEQFEQLCECARECYLKIDNITANAIASAITELIKYEGKTVSQVLSMRRRDIIDKASCYL